MRIFTMFMMNSAIFLLLVLSFFSLNAQEFGKPLNLPLQLSGNFGELRSNHFHTGIDIRTNGRTGHQVAAIENGTVSRIKVSPWGYGNVLYLDHPNGQTSVYAHLERFSGAIDSLAKSIQYQQRTFAIDTVLPAGVLNVRKGETIAISGNSGSSGGPHLHFEIRNTKTENAHNPLQYYEYPDNFKPIFEGLRVHPFEPGAVVNGHNETYDGVIKGGNGSYNSSRVKVSGPVTVSVKTLDRADLPGYTIGLYELKMIVNKKVVFQTKFDSLSFETNRAINAFIDYEHYCQSGDKFQRLWLLPQNPLFNINSINRGIIEIPKDSVVQVEVEAKDFAGNVSKLNFEFIGVEMPDTIKKVQENFSAVRIKASSFGMFHDKDIWVQFPEKTFYDDQWVSYSSRDTFSDGITRHHILHEPCVPAHKYFQISVMMPRHLQQSDKLVLVRSEGGKFKDSYTGMIRGKFFQSEVRNFGSFTLMEDLTPPTVTLLNQTGAPEFTIGDNLSGVKSFDLFVDDEWQLMEYDGKNRKLTTYTDRIKRGFHKYYLIVKDAVGNEIRYEGSFTN